MIHVQTELTLIEQRRLIAFSISFSDIPLTWLIYTNYFSDKGYNTPMNFRDRRAKLTKTIDAQIIYGDL